jgi:transcriptional regulator with XRE-family HTH domain
MNQEIGERLRECRQALGLSQAALAESTGSAKTTIQQYERGDSIPGGRFLRALHAMGVNVNWLLSGIGPMRARDLVATSCILHEDLMSSCLAGLEEHLVAVHQTLPPAKKAELVLALAHLLLEQMPDAGPVPRPSPEWIARFVRLAS